MSALDDFIQKNGPQEKTPTPDKPGNALDAFVSGKPIPPAKGVTPKAPVKTPYFAAVDPKGNSLGFSDQEKDASGKPYLAYRKPGDTSTTTDYSRVATYFDPRTPSKQTTESFYNPRAANLRAQMKNQFGIAYSDELDHKIALALSGSNNPANLRSVPKEQNNDSDIITKLQREVVDGKKSLFDAQVELAKWKKLPVPYTVKEQKPGIFDRIKSGVKSLLGQKVDAETVDENPIDTFTSENQKSAPLDAFVSQAPKKPQGMEFSAVPHIDTTNETKTSTPAVSKAPGTVDAFKYLFDPHGSVDAPRMTFYTDEQQQKLGKLFGPRIITGPAKFINNFFNGLIEGATQAGVDIYSAGKQFAGKSGEVKLPFNPTRIGFSQEDIDGQGNVKSLFNSTMDRLEQIDKESPNTPNLNLGKVFFEKVFNRAVINPIILGDATKSASKTILSWSKSSPQLGLSATQLQNLKPEDAVKEVSKRFFDRVNQLNPEGIPLSELSGYQRAQLQELIHETKSLGEAFSQGTLPQLNRVGQFFDDLSIKLNQDITNIGQSTGLTIGKINPAEETLPGYRPSSTMQPAGLSVQKVEPVGFGDSKITAQEASQEITNKVTNIKNVVKDPDFDTKTFYTDPKKLTINPKEAERIVYDISTDLNRFKPGLGDTFKSSVDVANVGIDDIEKAARTALSAPQAPEIFKGFDDLSTTLLGKLEGRSTVSRQFISDLTNSPELKQTERDVIRNILNNYPSTAVIPVKQFAEEVKAELLPLRRRSAGDAYEPVTLPDDLRGEVDKYEAHVYNSPIKTSAGNIHFGDKGEPSNNYFGHTRTEDIITGPDGESTTRRVIEVQSDLYQKGRLEGEIRAYTGPAKTKDGKDITITGNGIEKHGDTMDQDIRNYRTPDGKKYLAKDIIFPQDKLKQYNDPTAHFRMVREEIKKAGQDGIKKLQFPTGETAMKIEGLGPQNMWNEGMSRTVLKPEKLEVGKQIQQGNNQFSESQWIITAVLGDGKFKAVQKDWLQNKMETLGVEDLTGPDALHYAERHIPNFGNMTESFDISGKVDTNNPIYRFYEKEMGRYLKRYNAERVTDSKGVSWWQIPITEQLAKKPVEAFSRKGLFPKISGGKMSIEQAKSEIFKNIDKKDVRLMFQNDLIDGIATGQYKSVRDGLKGPLKPLIKLYEEGGKVGARDVYEEMGHFIFDNYLTASQKANALAIARQEMTAIDKLKLRATGYKEADLLEEYIVKKWAKAEAESAGFKGPLKKILELLSKALNHIVETYKKVVKKLDDLFPQKGRKGGYIGGDEPKKNPLNEFSSPVDKKIAQLETEYKNAEEALKNNPAKELTKYVNPHTGKLPEALGTGRSRFGRFGDELAQDIGYESSEEARLAYENYKLQKRRVDNLRKDLKTLKDLRVQNKLEDRDAKSLSTFLDKNATKTEKDIAELAKAKKPAYIEKKMRERKVVTDGHLSRVLQKLRKVSPASEVQTLQTSMDLQQIGRPVSKEEFELMNKDVPWNKIILDTNTPVKEKVNLLDYFRTPDRVLNKLGLGKLSSLMRHAYESYLQELPMHIDVISDWAQRVDAAGNKRIFRWLDGQYNRDYHAGRMLDPLSKEELKVAHEIKAYLAEWAQRLNLPDDNQISHYITHIFNIGENEKEFDEEIAKLIKDRVPGSVYDPFLEKRLGRRGYIEDTFAALDAYVKRGVRKANMDPVLERLKLAAGRMEDSQEKYLMRLGQRINLRPTEADSLLDNTIKTVFGYRFGQRPVALLSRKMRQIVYRSMLGLNIGSAIRNLTQGVNTFAKLGVKNTAKGYIKLLTKGLSNQELEEQGILGQDFVQDRVLSSTKKLLEKTDKTLFFFFDMAEKINRGAAYWGAKDRAIKAGFSEEKAIRYAKKIVRDTQFHFSSIDTPVGLNSDITKLLTQFISFGVKQTEFAAELVQHKDWPGIMRYIVGTLVLLYTVGQVFDLKAKDFIPGYSVVSRFDQVPPAFALPWEIIKALSNAPDDFGKPRTLSKKIKDIADSVPFPGSVQIKKSYRGLKEVFDPKKDNSKKPLDVAQAVVLGKRKAKPANPALENAIKDQSATRKATTAKATQEYERIQALPQNERAAAFDELLKNDPTTAKAVANLVKSSGLTTRDKKLNALGVENGARAKAIYDLIQSLPSKEEKAALWDELSQKKIITKVVSGQLMKLLAQP